MFRAAHTQTAQLVPVCALPPPPAGNSCHYGNGQMPLSSSCWAFFFLSLSLSACLICKSTIGGAAAPPGSALICLVKLEFLTRRSSSLVLQKLWEQPGNSSRHGRACFHLCRNRCVSYTPCGRRHFIQHGSIFDCDSAADNSPGVPFAQSKLGFVF